jgi:phage gpG-like protein
MNDLQRDYDALQAAMIDIMDDITEEARDFFDESWDNKGFTDSRLELWQPVLDKQGNVKERPLIDTGNLRGSIESEIDGMEATIFTEVDYAEYHNDGGDGGRPPQRQFMGESQELDRRTVKIIEDHIDKAIL